MPPPAGKATRTPAFWQTHTAFTSAVFIKFFPSGMNIGFAPHKVVITNVQMSNKSPLFGAWYASILKLANGSTGRSALDKARMQMLQQLVAAKLNFAATGAIPSKPTFIADADAAFRGRDSALILRLAGELDKYNKSGDNIPLPAGLPNHGSATSNTSEKYADTRFWDNP